MRSQTPTFSTSEYVALHERNNLSGQLCRRIRYLALVSSLLSVIVGCQGEIHTPSPTPPAPPTAITRGCPAIDPTQGACGGVHFLQSSLSCGGDGTWSITVGAAPGGADRFTATFQNGTRFSGKLITPDPGCWLKDGAKISIIFGVVYTGDRGDESGTAAPCITQSKTDFTSFAFDPPDLAPFESTAKDRLHQAFDDAVINQLYGGPGKPTLPGRCARWRQMP